MKTEKQKKFTALVMAARRTKGGPEPISTSQGLTHKCLATVSGAPMLERVVQNLQASTLVDKIAVSIETPDVLDKVSSLRDMREDGVFSTVTSAENLFASVLRAVEELGDDAFPLVITTADNVLHKPEAIDYFCQTSLDNDAGASIAMTSEETILAQIPEFADKFSYHDLRDGKYSNCNIYTLCEPEAVKAAAIMKTGGQFRIKPLRVLRAFGLLPLILYKFSLISFEGMAKRMSKILGTKVVLVDMPFAETSMDVDTPTSYQIATTILDRRDENTGGLQPVPSTK